jgi:hypothetical protein
MSFNFVFNSNNVVNNQNNVYTYKFPSGSFTIPEDSVMSINQITIPYSWYNITAAYGNNNFSYSMPTTGSTIANITVTLPDGFYNITDINNVLAASLRANNYYFYNINPSQSALNSSGVANITSNIIYPIVFSSQAPNYTNCITSQFIPSSGTNVVTAFGANWVWALGTYPTNATLPRITIANPISGGPITKNTYCFGNIIGFTNAVFPSVAQTYTGVPTIANSQPYVIYGNTLAKTLNNTVSASIPFPAIGSIVNGVIVRCNLCYNAISTVGVSDILDSFPITSTFGSNINYLPITDNCVKISSGKFNQITISFMDQNLNALNMLDPNVLISLLIKFPEKK